MLIRFTSSVIFAFSALTVKTLPALSPLYSTFTNSVLVSEPIFSLSVSILSIEDSSFKFF